MYVLMTDKDQSGGKERSGTAEYLENFIQRRYLDQISTKTSEAERSKRDLSKEDKPKQALEARREDVTLYIKVKQKRAQGGCLGTKSRRKT